MKVAKPALTAERLREIFHYDPLTGWLTRQIFTGPRGIIGARAGSLDKTTGYRIIGVDGNVCLEHRLVWLHVNGFSPPEDIDHINLNRSDNRISNLRLATRWQNCANIAVQANNKLGIKGVSYLKRNKKFMARIGKNNKTILLGIFETPEEAGEAYATAAREIFGEFART